MCRVWNFFCAGPASAGSIWKGGGNQIAVPKSHCNTGRVFWSGFSCLVSCVQNPFHFGAEGRLNGPFRCPGVFPRIFLSGRCRGAGPALHPGLVGRGEYLETVRGTFPRCWETEFTQPIDRSLRENGVVGGKRDKKKKKTLAFFDGNCEKQTGILGTTRPTPLCCSFSGGGAARISLLHGGGRGGGDDGRPQKGWAECPGAWGRPFWWGGGSLGGCSFCGKGGGHVCWAGGGPLFTTGDCGGPCDMGVVNFVSFFFWVFAVNTNA